MDVTGSMDAWIAAAKETAMKIARDTREKFRNASEYRLAFVGYRDITDKVRFEVKDFTADVQAVEARLRPIEATGGDDTAEDVAGGLHQALQLSWRNDVRVLFHVADAPAHGRDFHTVTLSDRYPGGDPDGRDPRALMHQLADKNIDYTFVKICGNTDKMIEEFHKAFTAAASADRFVVLDLQPQMEAAREVHYERRRYAIDSDSDSDDGDPTSLRAMGAECFAIGSTMLREGCAMPVQASRGRGAATGGVPAEAMCAPMEPSPSMMALGASGSTRTGAVHFASPVNDAFSMGVISSVTRSVTARQSGTPTTASPRG